MKRMTTCLLVLGLIGIGISLLVFAQNDSRLNEGFRQLDKNGDGQLSAEEVSRYPRLQTRIAGADRNGDGLLIFDEFRRHSIHNRAPKDRPNLTPDDSTPTASKLPSGDTIRTIIVENMERRYRVYIPKKYNPNQPTPVVIAFHGGGGNPTSMIRLSGLNEKADEAGFIVVYPFGSGQLKDRSLTFNAGNCCAFAKRNNIDDVEFVRAMLDDLAKTVNVDKNRVFATGISNGGIMAYRIASELSNQIAAVASVGGPMGTAITKATRPVSIIHFHGTDDLYAPFKGGRGRAQTNFYSVDHSIQTWVKANHCNTKPTVTELPDLVNDKTRVIRKTYGSCKNGTEVVLITIEGGGHTWPGREPLIPSLGRSTKDISANDLMWEFFKKHPMNQGA
jgi:polyhydroxybutyrate depolymerase